MPDEIHVTVIEQSTQRGVAGVAVTTGDGIELTDADGRCAIAVDPQARFVWISCPQGKRAAGDFYRPLPADEAVFELADELASSGEAARLVQFTDTHVVGPGDRVAAPDVAEALDALVSESTPDLIIASGDLTNLGTDAELAELRSGLGALETPLFPMFGGHDGNSERRIEGNQPSFTLNWESCFGPTYYSFDWAGRHIAVWPNEEHFFSEAERERKKRWLDADLAPHAHKGNTILVIHTPPSGTEFIDQMHSLGVSLILHGHWHSSKAFTHTGVTVVATPPLCFGGIDTSPRGYRVVEWMGSTTPPTRVVALGAGRLQPASPEGIGPFRLAWAKAVATDSDRYFTPAHRAVPAVSGERLLIGGGCADAGAVQCRAASTGELIWTADLESAPRNSVTIVDTRVLALAMTGALYSLRVDDGSVEWRTDLEGSPGRWLYTAPVHADGIVYAGSKAGFGAFRAETGECTWYTELEQNDVWPCYASPLIAEEVIVLLVSRRGLLALSRIDGRIAWETDIDVEYYYAAPVRVGEDVVTGGNRQGLARLSLSDGAIVWQEECLAGLYPAGMAADDEHLYVATPSGVVQALDPGTGTEQWRVNAGRDLLDMTPYERGVSSLLASPTRVGSWLIVGGNDGVLRLIDPASGEVRAEAALGAPVAAPAQAIDETGFALSTWDGRLLRYDSTAT